MARSSQTGGGLRLTELNRLRPLLTNVQSTMNSIYIWISIVIGHLLAVVSPAQDFRTDEGFTEPLQTVTVASSEAGVIEMLHVREGQHVRQGDVLCRLHSQVLTASLQAAQARVDSPGKIHAAQATLENKLHLLTQMQDLLARQHASEKEVRQAQLDVELAKASLQSAQDEMRVNQLEVKKIEAQIERRIIRAPTEGVVLELPRQEGEAITASDSQVATIVRLDQLRVRYFLSTEKASQLNRGQQTIVRFSTTNQTATATIDFVAPVTDSNSGTVRVEMLIDNSTQVYRSGLRCVFEGTSATAHREIRQPSNLKLK